VVMLSGAMFYLRAAKLEQVLAPAVPHLRNPMEPYGLRGCLLVIPSSSPGAHLGARENCSNSTAAAADLLQTGTETGLEHRHCAASIDAQACV